jgi:hypothetical protein
MSKIQTNAEKKIMLQFERFTQTDMFKSEIDKIRKILKIPTAGVVLSDKMKRNMKEFIKLPEKTESSYIAEGFRFRLVSKYPETVKSLESMFPVMNYYFSLLLRNYIYYNIFLYDELSEFQDPSFGICDIWDAEREMNEYFLDDDPESSISINSHNKHVSSLVEPHPIVLRIHADASQRDIVDYIKNNWKIIEGLKKKYYKQKGVFTLKNSRVGFNKKIKERNDFIYKHRHLNRKEIAKLVAQKFNEPIDYGHVGKIISLENAKRKEV